MDWTTAQGFMETFGFPVAIFLIFVLAIISPRRRNGSRRSSFLVPGWVHDELNHEYDDFRSKAVADILEARLECEKRIAYYRDLYETERERFLEVNALRQKDSAMIEELLREKVERTKRKVPSATA